MISTSSKYYAGFLAGMMLLTGSMNTIFLKYQNYQQFVCTDPEDGYHCEIWTEDGPCVVPDYNGNSSYSNSSNSNNSSGSNVDDGPVCVDFEQPVYQTSIMFIGETLCFITYYSVQLFREHFSGGNYGLRAPQEVSLLTGWRKLLFIVPTWCDLTATTLMNVGLIYTTASVYQMLRGAVVVFTGVLSVIFLKRTQYPFHILGMIFVVAGVTIVGLASVLFQDSGDAKNALLGDTMVIAAQLFSACQFVFEEKYLAKYNVPALQAVGFEGIYGILSLAVIAPILQVTAGDADSIGNLFDIMFAFHVFIYPAIYISTAGCAISIAFFNFFGLSVTKVLGATARTTIDACRTLTVWAFSLSVGWETFAWDSFSVQLTGFAVMLLGTLWYNKVLKVPFLNYAKYEEAMRVAAVEEEERKPLVGANGTSPIFIDNGNLSSQETSPLSTPPRNSYSIQ